MPTYEFRCPDGHVFDKFYRSISAAEAEVPCPTCGKVAARQISGGAGLQFKGSGFYLTDYGKNAHRGGARPAAATGDGKGGDGKGGDAKGGDSKGGEAKGGDAAAAPSAGAAGDAAKPAAGSSGASSSGGSAPSGGDA